MSKRCECCQFFHRNPPAPKPGLMVFSADGVLGGGECRFNPPVSVEGEYLAQFPLVSEDCWCGAFVERPEEHCCCEEDDEWPEEK